MLLKFERESASPRVRNSKKPRLCKLKELQQGAVEPKQESTSHNPLFPLARCVMQEAVEPKQESTSHNPLFPLARCVMQEAVGQSPQALSQYPLTKASVDYGYVIGFYLRRVL